MNTEVKTFNIKLSPTALAVAELTFMDPRFISGDAELWTKHRGEWYYFNRINVPHAFRGQGYGKQLMQQVIEWADQEHINILDELNPYGGLSMDQLIRFNMKRGFEMYKDHVMVRYWKRPHKVERVDNLMYQGCEPHWRCVQCGDCIPFHCYTKTALERMPCGNQEV